MAELRLYDRSRTTTDWQCPRKRWWQYEYDGKGIVTGNTQLALYLGTALHDGLAGIANQHLKGGVDIEPIANAARQQILDTLLAETNGEVQEVDFANEQAALVEGLLRGFARIVWPRLMKEYPTIRIIEQEMVYEHDGLTFMSTPDLVLEDKEGNLWYVEYKSTSSKKEGWVNGWATAVQLHSTIKAIEATLNEKVTGVIVQGLYKGFESYGKQSSPFCYAYRRNGNPPFSETETIYEYKAGFKRVPTWELAGGVREWVNGMPDSVLSDQFPQVPPIFVKDDLVNSFFEQRKWREQEIKLAGEVIKFAPDEEGRASVMDVAFPQRFDQCHPYFGAPCSYLRLCHGHVSDPLNEGYVYRISHHPMEVAHQEAIEAEVKIDEITE